jgi:hypothetical protein
VKLSLANAVANTCKLSEGMSLGGQLRVAMRLNLPRFTLPVCSVNSVDFLCMSEIFYVSPDLRMSELHKLGSVCSLTVLKNEKAKFKLALRKYLNTHCFYSVDEFFMCKDDL